MKFSLSLILVFSCFVAVKAQNDVLPVDDQGKFIYYEVVELKNTPKDLLKSRAIAYLNKKNSSLKYKSAQGDTAFNAAGKIIISKTLLVMSHPSGEILYNFRVEVRNGKYRFWMSDFNFVPYQRDRYGNFVATTNLGTPLEHNPAKTDKAQWTAYQVQAAAYAKDLATKLKDFMANIVQVAAPAPEKKVVSKSW